MKTVKVREKVLKQVQRLLLQLLLLSELLENCRAVIQSSQMRYHLRHKIYNLLKFFEW